MANKVGASSHHIGFLDHFSKLEDPRQINKPLYPVTAAPPVPAPRTPRKPKTGARAGTRLIAGHFPEATLKALKHLMAEEDTTLQALLEEAIHGLLVKKGMAKGANPRM